MNKSKIKRLALAAVVFVAVMALFVAEWYSQLVQAIIFGVVIIAMLIFAIIMTLAEGANQGENYH
jgi:hypothetical protein